MPHFPKIKKRLLSPVYIDNGSTDVTKNFSTMRKGIDCLINKKNMGVAHAWNQGIRQAQKRSSDYYLIINNDILWTPNIIERLLHVAESEPEIGIVGPVSNFASAYQSRPNVDYQDYESLCEFTEEYYEKHQGDWQEVDKLIGFCLLIKREVVEKIGNFDERFGIGNFEDDDFCRRAMQAGFKLVVANDVFLHHYGSKTFEGNKIDRDKLIAENRKKFNEKWGSK